VLIKEKATCEGKVALFNYDWLKKWNQIFKEK
jgi:hypothetical protein